MIIGTGIDLCDVKRIEEISQRFGIRFEERLLTLAERERAEITPKYLARRFAVKEAIAKALGCGIGQKLSFQDITILKNDSGQPHVELSAQAKKSFGGLKIHISITQEKTMAAATAIAEKVDNE
ncbi:MAG: holo-ACP synthase [Alphaproteobacteria bacterium]|nr:holo-ACP synthase [Alphaproteobacteria bacterium]MDD9920385.1 holo-ACP synthase [Alphaproteobacteria bacterium]